MISRRGRGKQKRGESPQNKMNEMKNSCQTLAELITRDQRVEWIRSGYTHDEDPARPGCAWVAVVKPGTKYTKINVGSSGKYMVDNATGEIFGIKGYGVIHRGHRYGTLDTIQDWDWSGHTAQLKKSVEPATGASNPMCDGSGPCDPGRVRVLPAGGDANMILCRCCFERELAFRRERNKELAADCAFDLPGWLTCEIYGEAVTA